jgi:hypothetical protein
VFLHCGNRPTSAAQARTSPDNRPSLLCLIKTFELVITIFDAIKFVLVNKSHYTAQR